jgi:hypothetical protein
MPNGKWVAFEGYDTLHNCKKPIARNPSPGTSHTREQDKGIYDDLPIPEIEIGKVSSTAQQSTKAEGKSSDQHRPPILPPVGYEQPRSNIFSKMPPIVWWIAVGLIAYWMARLN